MKNENESKVVVAQETGIQRAIQPEHLLKEDFKRAAEAN